MTDTIFALATAPGRAAVAVLRLSGPAVEPVLRALAGGLPQARRASLRTLRGPSREVMDRAIVLWSPGPESYTGEDCAELHLHGGAAVIDAVTETLLGLGVRPAEPGEFTRRAFENGKLDLSQAEAVADLVEAETEAQRRQALGQLNGDLGRRYAAVQGLLTQALAFLEAAVDFPDEDLPETTASAATPFIADALASVELALAEGARGERVREGFRIALVGAPNAGKSSLFNALVGRDAAIVTPAPGTTRDVIEAPLTLAGYRVLLADTAGVRPAEGAIEAEGVRRAQAWARDAALRLLVVDGAGADEGWRSVTGLAAPGDICVLNKCDIGVGSSVMGARRWAAESGCQTVEATATTGDGVSALRDLLVATVTAALAGGEFPAATRARHRRELEQAREHLARAGASLASHAGLELAAEDVRLAMRSLERIGGRVSPEDVLGEIFSAFCIGK